MYHWYSISMGPGIIAGQVSASNVVQLKWDSLADSTLTHNVVLAEFYNAECPHCLRFAPEYEEVADQLVRHDIPTVAVDCTMDLWHCYNELGVRGYPNITAFNGGSDKARTFYGSREVSQIVSFTKRQLLPLVSILKAETLEDLKHADSLVLIAFVNADDEASITTMYSVAVSLTDTHLVGMVHDTSIAESHGVKQLAVVLYKSFDEGRASFEGVVTTEAVISFAERASIPILEDYDLSFIDLEKLPVPLTYILVEHLDDRTRLARELRPVAEAFREHLAFTLLDISRKDRGRHARMLNITIDKLPAVAILDPRTFESVPFDQIKAVTMEAVQQFTQGYVDGVVEGGLTQAVPETLLRSVQDITLKEL